MKVGPRRSPRWSRPSALGQARNSSRSSASTPRPWPRPRGPARTEDVFFSSFRQDKATGAWEPKVKDLIARARAIGADGLDLSYKGPINRAYVAKVKASGLALFVWTVDNPEEARRLAAAGVDGITTNKAGWLESRLREVADIPAGVGR